jgi:putative RecB family exonuclease
MSSRQYEPPTTISPSRMSTFLTCPLKFKFESLDGVRSAGSYATVKGSCVHLALEYLFTRFEPEDRTVEALNSCIDDALNDFLLDSEFVALGMDEKTDRLFTTEVRKLALNYLDMEDPGTVNVKGVELRLEVEVEGWTMRGIIDRLDEPEPGLLEVVDYKSGRAPSTRWEQKATLGVHLYALMCEQEFGILPDEVKLLFVKDKLTVASKPTERSNKALRQKVRAVREAVWRSCETGQFGVSPSAICNFCDFKPICPAHGGDPARIVEFQT